MKPLFTYFICLMSCYGSYLAFSHNVLFAQENVFLNEIHYDNEGTDLGEAIELAGEAGTDLNGWQVILYNGNGGGVYNTIELSTTLTDETNGFGFLVLNLPSNGIQNGGPDGLALVDDQGSVVQFLSYEGVFTATDGPANGLMSEDIGVSESGATPAGNSLQLTGTGKVYEDFTWAVDQPNTFGMVNTGQSFGDSPQPDVANVFLNEIHYDNEGTDLGEAIELAGEAGTDLNGWQVILYNGNGGGVYNTIELSTTLTDETNGFGFLVLNLPSNGIQNGGPDGLALVDDQGSVVQFLSYEGVFTATDGPANGLMSEDIGVSESGATPAGNSLQLTGTGKVYEDFTWAVDQPNTFGMVNTGQSFGDSPQPDVANVFLNEIHYDNEGTDLGEAIELAGEAGTDLNGWQVILYNGNGGGVYNTIELSTTLTDETNGFGFLVLNLPSNGIQNGGPDGLALVDDQGSVVQFLSYEGVFTATDGPANGLMSEDIGVSESGATPAGNSLQLTGTGKVYEDFTWAVDQPNTFGMVNTGQSFGDQPTAEPKKIHEIQGSGSSSPLVGQKVKIEAIVVGDFQGPSESGLSGFYVQEEDADADGNPSTSEGLFIFEGSVMSAIDVSEGDLVEVSGFVSERFGQTQLDNVSVAVVSSGNALPQVSTLRVPYTDINNLESLEGMLVEAKGDESIGKLTVTEFFNFDRFGEVLVSVGGQLDGRFLQYTQFSEPSVEGFNNYRELFNRSTLLIDDGRGGQNLIPSVNGAVISNSNPVNTIRGGDQLESVKGILGYAFGRYRIQPTEAVQYISTNQRPSKAPEIGGELKIASFNVQNYFNGDGNGGGFPTARGAETLSDFERQSEKIVAAIIELDADIVALQELENDGFAKESAIQELTDRLNAIVGEESYSVVRVDGPLTGTDAITVGIIYQVSAVSVIGEAKFLDDRSLPDGFVGPLFDGINTNRNPLAQSFHIKNPENEALGSLLTICVNHLKSKGGSGTGDDEDKEDGQGNWNKRRTDGAKAVSAWLETNPTGIDDSDKLILGDLNSYRNEDPIRALEIDGYRNRLREVDYSFVFDGQWGSLDYILANESLDKQAQSVVEWHINADELDVWGYSSEFNDPSLFEPDFYRHSDHDPLLASFDLDVDVVSFGSCVLSKDDIFDVDEIIDARELKYDDFESKAKKGEPFASYVITGMDVNMSASAWEILNDCSVQPFLRMGKDHESINLPEISELPFDFGWKYLPLSVSLDGKYIHAIAVNHEGFTNEVISISEGTEIPILFTLGKPKQGRVKRITGNIDCDPLLIKVKGKKYAIGCNKGDLLPTEVNLMVENMIKPTISLYPNPTANFLNLEIHTQNEVEITLTDMMGRVVYRGQVSSGKNQLDVSSLQNGVYILNAVINKKPVNLRFMKN